MRGKKKPRRWPGLEVENASVSVRTDVRLGYHSFRRRLSAFRVLNARPVMSWLPSKHGSFCLPPP